MILLLPVSRFSVAYELAAGRPYSRLERRVLEAVAAGGASLDELASLFRVHERLLVECVVTLVGAGWVALVGGGATRFVLTREGSAAVESGEEPLSIRTRAARPQTVFLERVAGQVARGSEVRAYTRDELEAALDEIVKVKPRVHRNSLDEAQVQQLLSRSPGEWPRWVGPITLTSKDALFVPVDMDLDAGTARGLPSAWTTALLPLLRAVARGHVPTAGPVSRRASGRPSRFRGIPDAAPAVAPTPVEFDLAEGDVVVGAAVHYGELLAALQEPGGALFVSTPAATLSDARGIADALAAAVGSGKRIDLAIGAVDGNGEAIADYLRRACYTADRARARDLLRIETGVEGTRVPLLMHHCHSGTSAVVGNHVWLGETEGESLGLRIAAPGLISQLARVAATLCAAAGPATAASSGRWRQVALRASEDTAKEIARRRAAPDLASAAFVSVEEGTPPPAPTGVPVGARWPSSDPGITGIFLYVSGAAAAALELAAAHS